ncbi:MAG TPA: M6 family metalloprotease domain-containing protein [Ramlibacter sp.]|nr:M6 family metalloprotease domain-containing protein [Ramlibacter sp.]
MSLPPPHSEAGHHTGLLPKPRWQQRIDLARVRRRQLELGHAVASAPPPAATLGDCLGLCLPVEFPDVPRTLPREEIEAFCNRHGYPGFGNNGSVFDYYFDNSGGSLRYRTLVAPYYMARHDREYYTDENVPQGQRSAELVREALEHHLAHGFDVGELTVDAGNAVRATNLLYAGPVVNAFAKGLWPHASTMTDGTPAPGGRLFADFQVCAMDSELSLGVYCHENGHMLCDFPDLYRFGSVRAGCGNYCLMSFGAVADVRNPPQIGAYLKYRAGWGSPELIARGKICRASAQGNRFFILEKSPGATEYFLIEHRQRSGRDAALAGEGLAIWHIDELGSNTAPDTAPRGHRHDECALVQADGRDDLAGVNDGDDSDLFSATGQPVFSASGKPSSRWWDGTPSGPQISRIRPFDGGLEFVVA